jgi:hypothetical protein
MKRDLSYLNVLCSSVELGTPKRQKTAHTPTFTEGPLFSSLEHPTTIPKLPIMTDAQKDQRLQLYYQYQAMLRKEVEEVSLVSAPLTTYQVG